MKQNITKEQWNELDEGYKILWIKQFRIQTMSEVIPCSDDFKHELYPTIGQMIEFLEDDLFSIEGLVKNRFRVAINGMGTSFSEESFTGKLVDALWKAIKYKVIKS